MTAGNAMAVEAAELIFEEGIIGVPRARRFELMEQENSPVRLLRCLDIKGFALPVVDPLLADPDYRPDLHRTLKALGCERAEDVLVMAVACLEPDGAYANLRAPIVLHVGRRSGAQVILDDMKLPLRALVKMNG
jgi:flagellar assembly factor FliW